MDHTCPGGCILATNKNSNLHPSGNTSVSSTRSLEVCLCQEALLIPGKYHCAANSEDNERRESNIPLLSSLLLPFMRTLVRRIFCFPNSSLHLNHQLPLSHPPAAYPTPCPWYANLSPWCHFGAMMSGMGRHRAPGLLWALLLLLLLLCHSSPLPPALWMGRFSQWMDWVRV